MKRILFIRHGDADWPIDCKKDFDRPLSHKGKEEAHLMANKFVYNKFTPDIFYCSSSQRTIDTCKIISRKLKSENIIYSDGLYSDTLNSIKEIIFNVPKIYSFISIVAHNPHIHSIYNSICSNSTVTRKVFNFPPCGAMLIESNPDSWKEFNLLSSVVVNFDAPDIKKVIYK